MRSNFFKFKNFSKGSVVCGVAVTGLFCAVVPGMSSAQQRAGGNVVDRYEQIDQPEGVRRMAAFRGQRLMGDYCFRFELEHLPRGQKTVRYYGTMWGSWNEQGPVTRVKLNANFEVGFNVPVELIIQSGPQAKVWSRNVAGDFELLKGDALFESVIPGVTYSAFDLQMPFVYWEEFLYEGPARERSQIVQLFSMQAPVGSYAYERGISAVRLGLHDVYDALFRVEVLDENSEELSRFTVESFKKVQGQYIVKEVTLKDYTTRDRTRFKVQAARVGLALDEALFDAYDAIDPPVINREMFEEL